MESTKNNTPKNIIVCCLYVVIYFSSSSCSNHRRKKNQFYNPPQLNVGVIIYKENNYLNFNYKDCLKENLKKPLATLLFVD